MVVQWVLINAWTCIVVIPFRTQKISINPESSFMCVHATLLQPCPTLCDPMDCSPPGFSVHGDSPGKDRGVGCHALLQGILWIRGLNPYLLTLLHWQVGSLPLVPPEKPKFLHTSSQSITSILGNHCSDFFCHRWAVLSVIETYINRIMHYVFFCVRLL